MGLLTDNNTVRIEVADSHLAHLEIVMVGKMRRGEPFLLSWRRLQADGAGRSSVWIHPMTPLAFTFDTITMPSINPQWITALFVAADSDQGLRVLADPADGDIGELPEEWDFRAAGDDVSPRLAG